MAQNAHSATAPASGTAAHAAQTRNGFICLFTTYAIWGMLPLYFYLMASSSALEIVLSRVIFSLVFCAVLLPIFRLTKPFNQAVRTPRTMGILTVASLLIGANWMIYVYSTTHGHTIDMSLGYFINPLVSVVLGVVFLHERLRKVQWVAIGISTVAVLIMSVVYGQIPWLGLGVAFTFGTYGLLKARVGSSVHPVVSLSLETFILLPVALVVLWWMNTQGQLTLFSQGPGHFWLLASTGIVTVTPLVLFSAAARALPLSVIGMVQYMGPTIQFFLALFVLHDRITPDKWIGLSLIWVAIVIFTVDAVCASRTSRPSKLTAVETGMIPIVQISQSSEGGDDREQNYLLDAVQLSPEDTEDSAASASDKKGGGLSRLIAGRGRAGCRGTHRFSRAWRLMWGRRPARRPHGVLDCSSKRLGQRGWDCVGDLLDLGREGSF